MTKPKTTAGTVSADTLSANSAQVGGDHYQSEYQHWDFTADVLEGRYMEGQITKYVSRWRKKNGRQDLMKATHFLTKLLEQESAGLVAPIQQGPADRAHCEQFCLANGLDKMESLIILSVSTWATREDLLFAGRVLDFLLSSEP